MYQIIAAAVGAIIGGVTQGVTTAVNTNKKVDALRKAAEKAYNLADEYSGTNLNRKMTEAGQKNAQELSRESLANQLNNYQPTTGNAMANVNNRQQFNSNYQDFYNQGANREAQMANAEYNKGTADIERNLKQADIDYNVANQTSQAVMNGIGNAAGTIGDMAGTKNATATSDENCKEPINNDSGLPRADIQDSLRQLESVKYKYTDEAQSSVPGTDDEEHVGTVTQSMEKTPLFSDAVIHDENGIGKVDLFRLNEAIEAGLAEMQREIDELSNTATSDERCKEMETAIESNPVEAAAVLPNDSNSKKEALQITEDGDKRNDEVNDAAVEEDLKKYTPEELNDAFVEVNNINYDLIRGDKKRRSKEEKEELEKWIEEQEQKDQVEMNPGAFLPESYKALVKAEPRDIATEDNKELAVVDDDPIDVEYEVRDAKPPIDESDRKLIVPPLSLKSNPKTLGYNKPSFSAGDIAAVDNSLDLDEGTHTVGGGSTSKTSFSGGSGGGGISTGSTITPQMNSGEKAMPSHSFGGGRINLLGASTNPTAVANSSSNGVVSGEVVRSEDPNMSEGGRLKEERAKLPGGWTNNQGPSGELDVPEESKDDGTKAQLKDMLQQDSATWDGNDSGDKYEPYVFFVVGDKFFVQIEGEVQPIDDLSPDEIKALLDMVNSNK